MTYSGQNITMYQGDTKRIYVTVLDSSGNVKDISGSTIVYGIYKMTTGNVIISKTTTSGISLTDPLNGVFRILLNALDTENIQYGLYQHECQLTDSSNDVSTIFTGKVTINDSKV